MRTEVKKKSPDDYRRKRNSDVEGRRCKLPK